MNKILTCVAAGLLASSLALAQQKKLKVYISADMEGVGGVSTWQVQAGSKGREYELPWLMSSGRIMDLTLPADRSENNREPGV